MEEEKRVPLSFTCPDCSKITTSPYTKRGLEKAREAGELPVYCVECEHLWKRKLSPEEKESIKNVLDSWSVPL
jgi:DNA-directed RNA polymerase subunit M/transcription elongation factor TFIIS